MALVATIRTPANTDIHVLPNVQAFADRLVTGGVVGASDFGTYYGHQPAPERAVDIFHPQADTAKSDAICRFALGNWGTFGLRYIISRQRINYGDGWELMADRGSPTDNHQDHVHAAFNPITQEGFSMLTDADQTKLLATVLASNNELAQLATVIRDPQYGIATELGRLRRDLDRLAGTMQAVLDRLDALVEGS